MDCSPHKGISELGCAQTAGMHATGSCQQRRLPDANTTHLQVARALDKYAAQQAHALVVAAHNGDVVVVEQLLADKVLPGSTSYDGKTALEVGSACAVHHHCSE